MEAKPLRPANILIVDDHPIVLSGLKLLLGADPRFVLAGEATTPQDACALAEAAPPDLIVTDLVLGGRDGTAMIEDLLAIAPDALIVVYSSRDEALWARHALDAGARAYVAKSEPLDTVVTALETIMAGGRHVSPAVDRLLADETPASRSDAHDISALSPRELEILTLMGGGHSPQMLGRLLQLSVKTVGTYRERLKIKLGFDSVRMLERFAEDHVAKSASSP